MVLASPFLDVERGAGASLQSYGGLELPEKFVDAMAEYEATRAGAGLFDLSFRGALEFRGADRATFLHNLLSNDVLALRPGEGCYTTLLTQQSKVVADGNVLCGEESILFDLDLRLKDRAREHLEKYLVADDVEIEDRSSFEASLGIHGPRASAALAAALGGVELPARDLSHVAATIAGVAVRVVRVEWTGDPGFEVAVPRAEGGKVWRALLDSGQAAGLRPAGMVAFNVLRVEAGVPWVGVDVDESHLVLEAGLERGISFTKGCYLGQEVVERASARGHVNRKLVGLRLEGRLAPRAGAKILNEGAEVGHVTSAVLSPALGAPIALGYVRREAMEPGSRLEVEVGAGKAAALVVATPFVRRQ